MRIEEFIRAVTNADFQTLIGKDKAPEFQTFVADALESGREKIVIRFLFHRDNGDGVPTPYYMWAAYPLKEEEELVLYPPKYENFSTYLEEPAELAGEPYFEVVTPQD